jgi:hypothetical protein
MLPPTCIGTSTSSLVTYHTRQISRRFFLRIRKSCFEAFTLVFKGRDTAGGQQGQPAIVVQVQHHPHFGRSSNLFLDGDKQTQTLLVPVGPATRLRLLTPYSMSDRSDLVFVPVPVGCPFAGTARAIARIRK